LVRTDLAAARERSHERLQILTVIPAYGFDGIAAV
jgi:hypothetical protein